MTLGFKSLVGKIKMPQIQYSLHTVGDHIS